MPANLTSKGQVTIPKHIGDGLQLLPVTAVEFAVNAGGEVVLQPASLSGKKGAPRRDALYQEVASASFTAAELGVRT